jgi:hypothetical protein
MRKGKRTNKELLGLGALFVLFIALMLLFERVSQKTVSSDVPSTLNAQAAGAKALYLLLQHEGFTAERMEAPWTELTPSVGLLIVIEPLRADRGVTAAELATLKSWTEAGGTVLFLVTFPPRGFDAKDLIAGDIAIIRGDDKARDLTPVAPQSPYVRNVSQIHVASPVRLSVGKKTAYQILFKDEEGALAAEKPMGKGHILLLANSVAASNRTIAQADNAILLVNIAAETLRGGTRTVMFDEYHHGVGFESRNAASNSGLFADAPKPLRFVLLHLCAFGALILYMGNRRFGPLRTPGNTPYRPSTDYVGSMARLFRRANAGDIAIVTLYRQFVRDLRRQLDLTPDTPLPLLAARAARVYSVAEGPFAQFLQSCEAIDQGGRITESTMLQLARELDQYRRSFNLVGHQ